MYSPVHHQVQADQASLDPPGGPEEDREYSVWLFLEIDKTCFTKAMFSLPSNPEVPLALEDQEGPEDKKRPSKTFI